MVTEALDLVSMLGTRMSYEAERQKVLAQNMASIDIPGYQARDLVPLDFSNVLKAQTSKIDMTVTEPGHMSGMSASSQRFMTSPIHDPFEVTPTGSTVVVEEQMFKIAQNASDYQLSTNLYKKVGNLFKEALGLAAS